MRSLVGLSRFITVLDARIHQSSEMILESRGKECKEDGIIDEFPRRGCQNATNRYLFRELNAQELSHSCQTRAPIAKTAKDSSTVVVATILAENNGSGFYRSNIIVEQRRQPG